MKKEIFIGGVLTTVLIINALLGNTGCWDGWKEGVGEFIGYYSCKTKTRVRFELCSEIYNSVNTENYWCTKGEIEIPEVEARKPNFGRVERCTPIGCS